MARRRLAIDDVRHAFAGTEVLHGVSLAVQGGEILCLLGPSGCGKTTLLRLVAGLERVQSGRISIDGRVAADPVSHVPPERRGVGMVFQDFALFPHLSVADNVAFGVGGTARARRSLALDLLARVGMTAQADAFPHTLSGGQQQRVALARALAPQPSLLLLDEPFSGLDARLRGKLRDDTLHLIKGSGVATLMVTHDPEEAMFMADRIALMERGCIAQLGAPAELYLAPVSAFVAEFFGEVNRIVARVAGGAVATPFGPFPAPALPEGSAAEVLIRPEALSLAAATAPGTVPARIIAARLLGRTSLIHLGLDGGIHLHARTPADALPPEGAACGLRLDRRKAYVFPARPAATLDP